MEHESKLLSELRVIDLRRELEKRGLDKGGVKAVLMERLSKVSKPRRVGSFTKIGGIYIVSGITGRRPGTRHTRV